MWSSKRMFDMNVTYLSSRLNVCGSASAQVIVDFENFAGEMGFNRIILKGNFMRILQMWMGLKKICKSDFVVLLYPNIGDPIGETFLLSLRRNIEMRVLNHIGRKTKLIVYVVDLPIDQHIHILETKLKKATYAREQGLFETASAICVFNKNVKEKLISRCNLDASKFIEFELLDYGTKLDSKVNLQKYSSNKVTIVYSGALSGGHIEEFFKKLPFYERIKYVFIGQNKKYRQSQDDEYIKKQEQDRPDISYLDFMPTQDYIHYISNNAHFCIIEKDNPYHELVGRATFSSYMIAGVPVLVPKSYAYLAGIVNKYHVGIVYDDLSEIPALLKETSPSQCKELAKNAFSLGQKVNYHPLKRVASYEGR